MAAKMAEIKASFAQLQGLNFLPQIEAAKPRITEFAHLANLNFGSGSYSFPAVVKKGTEEAGTAVRNFNQVVNNELSSAKNAFSTHLDGIIATARAFVPQLMAIFVGIKLADMLKESALLSARVETLGVVLTTVGRNAGYTSGQVKNFVELVKSKGITTEAASQAVIRLAQADIDLAEAENLARVAQDAAVIGNMNSSQAFEQMIYGLQTANVRVLRTIGLNVNFEESYKRLANQLGKNTEQLTAHEKALARTQVVKEAGVRIEGTYEAAMGTAGKQLTSLSRYAEEAKEKFGGLFRGALLTAITGVTDLLKDANKELEKMTESGQVERISSAIDTQLRRSLLDIQNVIVGMEPAAKAIIPILGPIRDGWGYIFAAMKPVSERVVLIAQEIYYLARIVTSTAIAAGLARAFRFDAAKEALADVKKSWGEILDIN
ncbi:MAG: hypothetical protein ABFD81_19070, partial [Syntrophaceae bacterium]